MKEHEIEVWMNTADEWLVSLDGITVGKYMFESAARHQAIIIQRLNKEIVFVVIG